MKQIFHTNSPEETEKIANEFALTVNNGKSEFIAMYGDLGVGKTAFVRGVADFFGYTGDVTSPTFTLVNEYDGDKMTLYHFDAYRLENANTDQLDWIDDYLFGEGVCLIEWAEFITSILPDNTVFIEILKDSQKGEDYREIIVK